MPKSNLQDWPQASANDFLLLGIFADFYQEIACIKLALAQGRLAAYLAIDSAAGQEQAGEYASRVSARLLEILQRQERDFRRDATVREFQLQHIALYLMVALADEIFILELDWPGRSAWLDVLLEQKIFHSNIAGSRVFHLADQLLSQQDRGSLQIDLAAVFLLMLELGFKGKYRGQQGHAALSKLRQALFQMARQKAVATRGLAHGDIAPPPAFTQAYAYVLQGQQERRLAPLSPWFSLGAQALLAYLVLGAAIWLILMRPLENYING